MNYFALFIYDLILQRCIGKMFIFDKVMSYCSLTNKKRSHFTRDQNSACWFVVISLLCIDL